MIILLRTLPTTLRLPLLAHVYASLRTHATSTSADLANATHLIATRSLYDLAYDPKIKEAPLQLNIDDESELTSPIRVEGEAFVDAVGEVVEEYWKACQGKKGKGKGKEQASTAVWERFCSWLEEMEDESQDENLVRPLFLPSRLFADDVSIDYFPHFESHVGTSDRPNLINASPPPPSTSPANYSASSNDPHFRQTSHHPIRHLHPSSHPRRNLGRSIRNSDRPRFARRNNANL